MLDFNKLLDIGCNKPEQFKELYYNKEVLELKGPYKETIFHYLCVENQIESVKILINMGFDVNTTNHILDTPLHDCTALGHLEIVKLLLEHGADPNARNENGETPYYALEEAVSLRQNSRCEQLESIRKLLLSYGADPKFLTKTA